MAGWLIPRKKLPSKVVQVLGFRVPVVYQTGTEFESGWILRVACGQRYVIAALFDLVFH